MKATCKYLILFIISIPFIHLKKRRGLLLIAQLLIYSNAGRPQFDFWVGKICWIREKLKKEKKEKNKLKNIKERKNIYHSLNRSKK